MAELSVRHSEEGDDTKVGGFNVCQLALRFLISAAFDRLLHSSKAVVSIQVRERERERERLAPCSSQSVYQCPH